MIVSFYRVIKLFTGIAAILILVSTVRAEKYSVERYDRYLDSDVNFFDANGEKIYLEQYEGTNILLVFWATWCGACLNELVSLDNLQKDFKKLPFKVIAVSEDDKGVDIIKKYFTAYDIRYLEIFHDYKNRLFKELSVIGLPTAFFINAAGKNTLILKGSVKWYNDKVRELILSEIKGNPPTPKNSYKSIDLNRNFVSTDFINKEDSDNQEQVKSKTDNNTNESNKVDSSEVKN